MIDDFHGLCQEARWLIGFWCNKGTTGPCKQLTSWSDIRPGDHWGRQIRSRIAPQLPLIRHWTIIEGDYRKAPAIRATWFIDPPYRRKAGIHYKHSSTDIDFRELADWCRKQKGQVMVCENEGADWLPFKPFVEAQATRGRQIKRRGGKNISKEALWQNNWKSEPSSRRESQDPKFRSPFLLF